MSILLFPFLWICFFCILGWILTPKDENYSEEEWIENQHKRQRRIDEARRYMNDPVVEYLKREHHSRDTTRGGSDL